MAVLSKIRKHSVLLLVVIGFSLVAFLVGDAIQSGTFSTGSHNAGSVNGTDISGQEFLKKSALAEKQSPGISATQAQNSTWEQEVRRILLEEQIDDLGITIGKEQISSLIKQNPYFAQNPKLLNAAGKVDDAKFNEFVKSLQSNQNPQAWADWLSFEKEVEKTAKEQMYFALVRSGMYVTQSEAKARYQTENDKVDFNYVAVPFTTVNDAEVKVSDDELINYMKKYPKKYKSEESRSFEYVIIENKPSKADEEEMKASIASVLSGKVVYNKDTQKNDTLKGFANVATADVPAYVNANSDIKFDSVYVTKQQLPTEFQETLYNLPVGQVYGPYIANNYYQVSRMMGKKSGSSVKASHILIAYAGAQQAAPTIKRTKEEAKALAENLLKQANASNFAVLAMTNTDDQGSKQTGGMYDNIQPNQMVKPFNDYIFNNPVGKIGLVETDFGYHVIKVDAKYDAVQLATVALKIEPSDKTSDQVYTKASKFEADANSKDFATVAKGMGLTVEPAQSVRYTDEYVVGLGAQRQIVSWAFSKKTEVGDIFKFEVPQGFVIAKLKGITDNGVLPLEIARQQVEPVVRNQKKAEIIKKKMAGATLEAVSKATSASIQSAVGVTFANPFIPNIGQEPKVVGKALGLASGKTSGIIEGYNGMYMVQTVKVTKAAKPANYDAQFNFLKQQAGSSVGRVLMALKEKADIEDNRANMYQ